MTPTDETKLKQIAALKAKIPNVNCKGLCWRSCTAIMPTDLEREAIQERHGIQLAVIPAWFAVEHNDNRICNALDDNHRCKIWEDKQAYPTVCRAFGSVEHMPCPFGCVPEEGLMRLEDYKLLDADINDIGGSSEQTPADRVRLRQKLSTRTGIRNYRAYVFKAMERPYAWWRTYIQKNPDNLPLGGK